MRAYVSDKLGTKWSPQQISRGLRSDYPDDPGMRLSTDSIHTALYRPGTGLLTPKQPSPLRTGRDHRRRHVRPVRARRRFAQPMLSIHNRGFDPADRSIADHRKCDLIVGPHHRSAIGTLVERQTRSGKLLHLTDGSSSELHAVLVEVLGQLPHPLRQLLTWDQGTEMATHRDIAQDTGIKVFFCDAASPWQPGSNENTNGLLRHTQVNRFERLLPRDLVALEKELTSGPG
jgi:IS30 family transposase